MSLSSQFRFSNTASYEPEGIYLQPPLEGACTILQGWGEHPEHHRSFRYNGVQLKGHPGLDLAAKPGANVVAVDEGRVTEIGVEPGGFGRYLKIEHRWGESLYALLGEIEVDAGQRVERGAVVARTDLLRRRWRPHLHFAIRITPFNRFDGWGGFSDPLPFLYAAEIGSVDQDDGQDETVLPLMVDERTGARRP